MIDIHTHILPGIDDGAASKDVAAKVLELMQDTGVTDVVFTPHFITGSYNNTFKSNKGVLNGLVDKFGSRFSNLNLHLGAEILLDSESLNNIKKNGLTIAGSSYVLIETAINSNPNDHYKHMFDLLRSGYRPILAHPERYTGVIQDPSIVYELISKNIYMQINSGSLLGLYGKQVEKTAWFLLDKGWVHFVASDSHCKLYNYTLGEVLGMIENRFDSYTAKLLSVHNPKAVLENKKIDFVYVDESMSEESKENCFTRMMDKLWKK